MSRERQRARSAREQARRREVEVAAQRRASRAKRQELRARLTPSLPRRKRRYGALSTLELVRLVLVFAGVQAAGWIFLPAVRSRLAVAVLTLACLAVFVRTRRSPSR